MSGPKHNVNPAEYGWTYQGSNAQSRVEYWQNDQGAKMDYYTTTGTVSVSSDWPCGPGLASLSTHFLNASGHIPAFVFGRSLYRDTSGNTVPVGAAST